METEVPYPFVSRLSFSKELSCIERFKIPIHLGFNTGTMDGKLFYGLLCRQVTPIFTNRVMERTSYQITGKPLYLQKVHGCVHPIPTYTVTLGEATYLSMKPD